MNRFENFVQSYKDILALKKPHITSKKSLIDVLKLTVIMIAVSTFIGFITQSIENLSYVVNVLNTILIGSFIIYKVISEKRYKTRNELTYNTMAAIFGDCFNFAFIVITSSFIQQLMFLRTSTPLVMRLSYMSIVIIMLYYYGRFNWKLFQRVDDFKWYRNLGSIAEIVFIFYVILMFQPFASPALAVTLVYCLIILLIAYKSILIQYIEPPKYIELYRVFIWGMLIASLIYANSKSHEYDLALTNRLVDEALIPERNLTLDSKVFGPFTTDEYILIQQLDGVYLYNHDFELLNTFNYPIGFISVENNTIYFVSRNKDEPQLFGEYMTEVYYISNNEKVLDRQFYYDRVNSMIPYNNNYIIYVDDNYFVYLDEFNVPTRYLLTETMPEGFELREYSDYFYKLDGADFIFKQETSNGVNGDLDMRVFYSNEYVLYASNYGQKIMRYDEHFSNQREDLDNYISLDCFDEEHFLSTDNMFVLTYSDCSTDDIYITLLDESLTVTDEVRLEEYTPYRVSSTFLSTYEDNILTIIDYNNLSSPKVIDYLPASYKMLNVFLATILFTSSFFLPDCLGGEKYE